MAWLEEKEVGQLFPKIAQKVAKTVFTKQSDIVVALSGLAALILHTDDFKASYNTFINKSCLIRSTNKAQKQALFQFY